MKHIGKAIIVLLLSVVLVSCTRAPPPGEVSRSTIFTKGSTDSIVILGTVSGIEEKGLSKPVRRSFGLLWEQGESPPGKAPTGPQFVTDNTGSSLLGEFSTTSTADGRWQLLRIPAGTYFLRLVTKKFISYTPYGPIRYDTVLKRYPGHVGVLYFTVRPGEVRYLGDLHFDVRDEAADFLRLARSDDKALAKLAEYPGIQVRPYFRPPAIKPLATSEPVFLEVSQ
jgi:hypothetical protein